MRRANQVVNYANSASSPVTIEPPAALRQRQRRPCAPPIRSLGARTYAQLLQDRRHGMVDSAGRDHEPRGDRGIAEPGREQPEHSIQCRSSSARRCAARSPLARASAASYPQPRSSHHIAAPMLLPAISSPCGSAVSGTAPTGRPDRHRQISSSLVSQGIAVGKASTAGAVSAAIRSGDAPSSHTASARALRRTISGRVPSRRARAMSQSDGTVCRIPASNPHEQTFRPARCGAATGTAPPIPGTRRRRHHACSGRMRLDVKSRVGIAQVRRLRLAGRGHQPCWQGNDHPRPVERSFAPLRRRAVRRQRRSQLSQRDVPSDQRWVHHKLPVHHVDRLRGARPSRPVGDQRDRDVRRWRSREGGTDR